MVKQLTEKRLLNITLFYLSRYEASEKKVRAMLYRRLKRMQMKGEEVPPDVSKWIDNIIQKVQEYKYLDDSRYMETRVRSLVAQGRSDNFICAKLAESGISQNLVQSYLESLDVSLEERIRQYALKKKIGPFRSGGIKADFLKKDMATLARAGFPYDIISNFLKFE